MRHVFFEWPHNSKNSGELQSFLRQLCMILVILGLKILIILRLNEGFEADIIKN